MKTRSAFLLLVICCATSARGQTHEWTRQLVTDGRDVSHGVSADGLGNVYISGNTEGILGETNEGKQDAFLSKYDASGTLQWTRQLGTIFSDYGRAVSADGLGNVYTSSESTDLVLGTPYDAVTSKYDASGTLQWTRQLGTSNGDAAVETNGVSADGLGNVYISGFTRDLEGTNSVEKDAFVAKYDAGGTLEWTRQLGTSEPDYAYGVSADGLGSVYISGRTDGALSGLNAGGSDAFLSKYDTGGTLQWTQQLGTSEYDSSNGVSADVLGNVYISGSTLGDLEGANAGDFDSFVTKYDAGGTLQWTRQLGTSEFDVSNGVSADGLGNVYISGYTEGILGETNAGDRDAFVSKYDTGGTLQWTQQIGTVFRDQGEAVSADGLGSVYMSGLIGGFVRARPGGEDVFVAKFTTDFPEPEPDFDGDGDLDGDDVDALVGEIVAGTNDLAFDLTADAAVNNADLSLWLSDAATANGYNAPYLLGDANLDGTVNASDLNALGQNWLGQPNTWRLGDFTADGTVDANDLNQLGQNWLASIPSAASLASVPEPSGMAFLYVGAFLAGLMRLPRNGAEHVSNRRTSKPFRIPTDKPAGAS